MKKNKLVLTLLVLTALTATRDLSFAKSETLTVANFQSTISGTDLPIVVDFWAPWCGPCVKLAPTIDELATKTRGRAIVAKVNIDEHPSLAQLYGVQALPTIIFIKNGTVQTQLRGVQSLDSLMATLAPSMAQGSSPTEATTTTPNGRSMLDRLTEAASTQ